MFTGYLLSPVKFSFGHGQGPDKFRGLQNFGPYREIREIGAPRFGFVFPTEFRDHANRLYLALKNGLGYFRGMEQTFRVQFQKSQVFPITEFTLPENASPRDLARRYADAIISWRSRSSEQVDLFFVIHPRTSSWEDETPYYECKALLLQEGLLSQDVTCDLIDSPNQFEWSAANIALGAFVKLGGIPWIVGNGDPDDNLIIGLGRAGLYDPRSRQAAWRIGFTACFSSRGLFEFVSLGEVAKSEKEYLGALERLVSQSVRRIQTARRNVLSISLHVPKQFGREEFAVVAGAVAGLRDSPLPINVVKITDEPDLFAIASESSEGLPSRGTVIRISDSDYLLYTEGREERQAWRQRVPTALRITPQGTPANPDLAAILIRQIHDLSQVNWRGFNARSRPISTYYGKLIARILSHVPTTSVKALYSEKARKALEERMWFL